MSPPRVPRTDRPLRIAHVVATFPPATYHGGPIESSFSLSSALASAGHDVRVLTTDVDAPGRRSEVPIDREVTLGALRVRYCQSIAERPFAPTLLQRLPMLVQWSDVVHVTGVYEHHTIPALGLSRLYRKPVVWSARGALERWKHVKRTGAKAAFEMACRAVAPQRYAIHATSAKEALACSRRIPGADIVIVPNGVSIPTGDLGREALESARRSIGLSLVFLGRLHPIKAVENLIDAVALLVKSGRRDVHLSIGGDGDTGYRAELERRIQSQAIERHVRLVGHVEAAQKRAFFASAAVLVLPSHSENFGNVVAEALAHEVPVIASRGTPWADLERHECGRWVDNSPISLASAISEIATRDLATMGRAGRRWVEEELSAATTARTMEAIYRSLLEGTPLPEATRMTETTCNRC